MWGRLRYDLVAFMALTAALILGVVPTEQAFSGFGHPAVAIIALVLIVSRGLSRSGAIELLALCRLADWHLDQQERAEFLAGQIREEQRCDLALQCVPSGLARPATLDGRPTLLAEAG